MLLNKEADRTLSQCNPGKYSVSANLS